MKMTVKKRKYTQLSDTDIRSIDQHFKHWDASIKAAQDSKKQILKSYDISTTQFYNRKKKLWLS